jgi:hypothetical protein
MGAARGNLDQWGLQWEIMTMSDAAAGWVAQHRDQGHHPYPNPTPENPERWECKCDPDAAWIAVWRILTKEQIQQKFAHLRAGTSNEDTTTR